MRQYVEDSNLAQVSDPDQITAWCREVVDANPNQLEQYRGGKTKLKGFFVGGVLKKGNANPKMIDSILVPMLDE